MSEGSCHCGAARWRFDGTPGPVTACNCTICRRYGALWAYDYENEGIRESDATRACVSGKSIEFHFRPGCGCVAYWRGREPNDDGRRRSAVQVRLAGPDTVTRLPVCRFDGLDRFADLPRDGRCVAELWF